MNDIVQSLNISITEDKVYRLLELISDSPQISQRELAQSTGFSLGLVNLSIKRLIRTGHIKMAQMNKRKVQYNLTPKGMVEKAQRSYHYLSRTVSTFMEYHRRLEGFFKQLGVEGHKHFAILGEGEIVALVEMGLAQSIPDAHHRRIAVGDVTDPGETVLDCRLNGQSEFGISVMAKLLKSVR